MVSAFYYDASDPTFSEALIRSPTGPAVFIQHSGINDYFFYKSLLEGKTIGEAYYAGADYVFYGQNPYQLFGDPTLRLYERTISLRRTLKDILRKYIPFRTP